MLTAKEIHGIVQENRDEILECLSEVLRTPSLSGEETEVAKVFQKWIEKTGLETKIVGPTPDRPNVFAEWFGSRPGKRFIFCGHMDHHPPVEGQPDTYGPYSGKIADGCCYGRGASDMKSGDVTALMAVTLLKRYGFDPKGSILLNFVSDEELGSKNGAIWCIERGLLKGDIGLCPEASGKKIWNRQGGLFIMIVTYVSEGANTYRNHPTKSALEKSIIAINELFRLRKEIDGRTNEYGDTPSLNISTLHAGTMYTLHPSLSVFTIDRRMINGENLEQAKAEIIGLLDSLKAADPTMDYRWELHHERPGLLVPEDDPFVKICAEAYKEVTGRDVEFCMHNAGSDAANIRADCGISMPNWSGATGGMASKKDDRVNVEDMLEAVEYFMLTLVKAMG